jgi:type IV secretory pathway VirJ component
MKSLLFAGALMLFSAMATAAPTHLSHGRFKDLVIYSPPAQASSFVLFLSGDEGWGRRAQVSAEQLAQQGAMVVGIDLAQFKAVLEADGDQCEFPDGDLENLSHFVQAYFHSSTYRAPLIVGIDAGGSLAYAVLAQAPQDTFAGALSVGFCPHLNLEKPLCKGSGLELTHGTRGAGLNLQPIKSLNNPWVVLQDSSNPDCPAAATRGFVSQVRGAAIATLPSLSERSVNAAFNKLAAAGLKRSVAPTAALGDLPVVEVPALPNVPASDSFAIIMSGDGGWAGIDQNIAAALSVKGIPVVGWDSLRYYWTARTPQGVAADADKLIHYDLSHFVKKRVLLIGYSQGADVLPFAVNRLPAATKSAVSLIAILGMSEHALFEFHVSSWISDDNSGPETLPEVNRIIGIPVLCIYGEDEHDSLCPKLDANKFKVVKVKGGHHFDGNYAALADDILSAVKPQLGATR